MDMTTYESLTRRIYEGVLAPDGWLPLLEDLRAMTNSEHADILVFDRRLGKVSVGEIACINAELLADYERRYCFSDPVRPVVDGMKVGEWFFDVRDIGVPTMQQLEFYQVFLRAHQLSSIMALPIINNDKLMATMSFQGGARRAPYRVEDTAAIAPLVPHLLQAARLRTRFQELSARAKLGEQVLDQIHKPILVVDAQASVHFANTAGAEWLSGHRQCFSRNANTRQLSVWSQIEHLARQICGAQPQASGGIRLDDGGMNAPVYIFGFPLRADHAIAQAYSRPIGLLLVHDTSSPGLPWNALLKQLFKLTGAEMRLLEALWMHETLHDAADFLGVSRETARSQLKAVFQKTGSSSQQGLLRLVSELSQVHQAS